MHDWEQIPIEQLAGTLERRMGIPRRLLHIEACEGTSDLTVLVRTSEHSRLDCNARCFHWDFEENPVRGLWCSTDWACLIENEHVTGRLSYTEPYFATPPPGVPPRGGLRLHALLQPMGSLSECTLWWRAELRECHWEECTCLAGTTCSAEEQKKIVDRLELATVEGGAKLRIVLVSEDGETRDRVLCWRDGTAPALPPARADARLVG